MNQVRTKSRSLSTVSGAYVIAIAVAALWLWLGPDTGHLWLDALVADVLATLVIFGFSRADRNSSFYDAYWSVVPPLLLLYWWIETPDTDGLRTGLLFCVVVVWAVRLTGNWVYSFPGLHHEDWRYPILKERAGRREFLADLFAIHPFPQRRCSSRCSRRTLRWPPPSAACQRWHGWLSSSASQPSRLSSSQTCRCTVLSPAVTPAM